MKSLVFFVPIQESFAFLSIRKNLIRIPEVLTRLRETEKIVNSLQNQFKGSVDLISIMQSNWSQEKTFAPTKSNLKPMTLDTVSSSVFILRKKLSVIVSHAAQVGLFDRYLKASSYPDFIMHHSKSDKAALVALKNCSMKKMVQSILEDELPEEDKKSSAGYSIFFRDAGQYKEHSKIAETNFKSSFEHFTLQENLKAFIHIGPGQSLHINFFDFSSNQFTELEFISTDPLLAWFWSDVHLPIFSTTASMAI